LVPIAGILVLLVAVGAVYYAFRVSEASEVAVPSPPPDPKPEPPKQAAPVIAPAPLTTEPKPLGAEMVYPDGSRYPNLNGIKIGPAILWPKERPYSPVNGTIKDAQGVEWYTHVDGSRSTVMFDQGSKQPVSLVANPTAPVPVAEEDLKMLEEQKKRQQQQAPGKQ
jgi:hypothetical protein